MSDSSRHPALRRARIASCDPCRIAKLACDHRRPVCSRCSKKLTPEECVYRKNPFQRSQNAAGAASRSSPARREWDANVSTSPEGQEPWPYTPQLTTHPNTGFQGSTSLTSILDNIEAGSSYNSGVHQGASSHRTSPEDNGGARGATSNTMPVMGSTTMIEEGAQVLDLLITLLDRGILQHIFEEWGQKGLGVHLGAMLVGPFLRTFADLVSALQPAREGRSLLLAMSRRLFDLAGSSIDVSKATSMQQFAEQYTGQNLRWETVGLIMTLASNGASRLRAPHLVCETEHERHALRRDLLHSSNKCASFCESMDVLNELQIIFLYESFLLYSVYFGHQSFRAWGRLNAAINALFGRGLHQRLENDGSLPFFLVELRKNIFALLYGSDISFSVFLGRPPRISQRHCIIHVPLDMSPTAYSLDEDSLSRQLQDLDERGWNKAGHIHTQAVTRWSMTTSKIREKALEAILTPDDMLRDRLTRDLRVKIDEAWNDLPIFLTVPAREVWLKRRPRQETDTLYMIRLLYLQTIFLVEWTASIHRTEDLDSLFIIASELLAWVNQALIMRECLNRLGLNTLAWRVSAFGLPAAGALAKCMSVGHPQRPQKWRTSAMLSTVIQNISVLISHMDYLYDPCDGNFRLFDRAKGILKRVVESMLHVPDTPRTDIPLIHPPAFPPAINDESPEQWEFRPELWMGLPGPNPNDVNFLDSSGEFIRLFDHS